MPFLRCAAALAIVVALDATPAAAERAVPLATVLARAASYVAEFDRRLAGIVAEEQYDQIARRSPPLTEPNRIKLRSDLLLVKPTDADQWVQFRDVFEVDGRPVRDRQDRLTKLFLETSDAGQSQVMRILNESARYNIGSVLRNVNTPVFPLQFLDARMQHRFRFTQARDRVPSAIKGDATPPGVFRASTDVWVVEYRETGRPTIIRNARNKDVPATGRFWIDPADGRVLMAELQTGGDVRATIDVSFQSEPVLDMLVPVEMREHYEGKHDRSVIDAVATYGRFRQFQVNVDQTFLIRK